MRRGGACFARLGILKAVGGSETYVNLSDPFRILILKSSPRRDFLSNFLKFTVPQGQSERIHPSSASSQKDHQDEQCKQLQSSHLCQHYISLPIALHNEDLQEQRKDIACYCMPILCPFLAAATHLAKGNLEQLASGGPSNQEPLTLFFLAQAPMNGELVFSGSISMPFKDLCTCG